MSRTSVFPGSPQRTLSLWSTLRCRTRSSCNPSSLPSPPSSRLSTLTNSRRSRRPCRCVTTQRVVRGCRNDAYARKGRVYASAAGVANAANATAATAFATTTTTAAARRMDASTTDASDAATATAAVPHASATTTGASAHWLRVSILCAARLHKWLIISTATPSRSSNNPFAPSLPSLSTGALPSTMGPQTASPVSFNLQGTYGGPSSTSPPPPSHSAPPVAKANTMPAVKTRADDQHSQLANLLANREDGIDTFGNWGNLRCVHLRSERLCYLRIHLPAWWPVGTASRRQGWGRSRRASTAPSTPSRISNSSRSRTTTSRSSLSSLRSLFPSSFPSVFPPLSLLPYFSCPQKPTRAPVRAPNSLFLSPPPSYYVVSYSRTDSPSTSTYSLFVM